MKQKGRLKAMALVHVEEALEKEENGGFVIHYETILTRLVIWVSELRGGKCQRISPVLHLLLHHILSWSTLEKWLVCKER